MFTSSYLKPFLTILGIINGVGAYIASSLKYCLNVSILQKVKVKVMQKGMEEKSDDDIEEGSSEEEKKDEYKEEDVGNFGRQDEDVIPLCSISIPSLNISQEKAATSFINGPAHDLSLVQGPPVRT